MSKQKPQHGALLASYHRWVALIHERSGEWQQLSLQGFQGWLHDLDCGAAHTREELEQLQQSLLEDLHESRRVQDALGPEWRAWLRFDMGRVEKATLEHLLEIADKTPNALRQFQQDLDTARVFRAGQIRSAGPLQCKGCGQKMQFRGSRSIAPCPSCHGTQFRRP